MSSSSTNLRILVFFFGAFTVAGLTSHPSLASTQPSVDSALSFDGLAAFVLVPNNPVLELTDGTLELWFKPDWAPGSIAYDPILIANRQGPILNRYSLHVNRQLAGVILANGNSNSTVPYTFTRGQWYHLAVSETGSAVRVYVNGQLIGSTSNGFGTQIGMPLYLGTDGGGQFFRGEMEEVRIWRVSRSASDIRYNLSRALRGAEPGLVAYWSMNERIGTRMVDATPNRLDGTLFGPTWTNSSVVLVNTRGSFGMALDLSAARDTWVQVSPAPSLALTNQFTLEAWIKPRTTRPGTILSRGDGAEFTQTDYIFQLGTDGNSSDEMKLALMVAGEWVTSASVLPLNSWAHVAVTYDGTNKQFYIDGLLDRAVVGTGIVYQNDGPVFIGRQGSMGTNRWDGQLDEVRIWNTARSGAEIQTNLNHSLPASTPGLIGYWEFDEAGIRARDASGRGNHGRMLNRPARVASFWAPTVTMSGPNEITQECRAGFSAPGATANGSPLGLGAGFSHSLAVKLDGTVVGWGLNGYGQVNSPVNATGIVAVAAGHYHSLGLRADGTRIAWGNPPTPIPAITSNVVAIASGFYHGLELKSDGTVVAWGVNDFGQTNVPAQATNLVAIAAGGNFSIALRADGAVIGWGDNGVGQRNPPPGATNVVAISTSGGHVLALRGDGTLVGWGANGFGEASIPPSATSVISIATGGGLSMALRADGALMVWGQNRYGQTNMPVSATNIVGIAAGANHCLALRKDGTVLAWGANDDRQSDPPANLSLLSVPVTMRGSVNSDIPGPYSLIYRAANNEGAVASANLVVRVTDARAPTLTLTGANPIYLVRGIPFVDPGATALDECEGILNDRITTVGTVNPAVPGVYVISYAVTDSSDNAAYTDRTVIVQAVPSIAGPSAVPSGTNPATGLPVMLLAADVNANGLASTAFFQYGLGSAYAGRTAPVGLPASYTISTIAGTTEGLMPGAAYHYRVVASNNLGVAYGPEQVFTVPAPAPGDLNRDGRVDQAELDAVLSNYWPYSPWLAMTNTTQVGSDLFQFTLTNGGSWNFTVLAAEDLNTPLTNWTNLGFARPVWQFRDPTATNQSPRFYRLRWP